MAIFVVNLRMQKCDIAVDVGDSGAPGVNGTLELMVSGTLVESRSVTLGYPPHTESFSAPHDGLVHNVEAKLRVGGAQRSARQLLTFCSE